MILFLCQNTQQLNWLLDVDNFLFIMDYGGETISSPDGKTNCRKTGIRAVIYRWDMSQKKT